MRCARVRDCFDELFDGRLEEEQRRQAEQHLSACPKCASEYETMKRILRGIRKIPRPRAPILEVSLPPGRTPVVTDSGTARRWLLRAAAAVLLCALLGLSHALAFHLGDREHRDLAEIGRRELPRVVANYLDDASSQVQFARQVAKDDPTAVNRLVFQDELGREHQAMSHALLRVSDQPALKPVQATFKNIVERQHSLFSARRPKGLSGHLAGLEEQIQRLRRDLARLQASVTPTLRATDDEESVIRVNRRLLRDRRPEAVVKIVARFVNRHRGARFGNSHLWILGQSSLMLGEIPEIPAVQFLLRREGDGGVKSFLSPWIKQVKSGSSQSGRKMISIGLDSDPFGPLIQILRPEQRGAGVRFHFHAKTLFPGQPVDRTGFIDLVRILNSPKRN